MIKRVAGAILLVVLSVALRLRLSLVTKRMEQSYAGFHAKCDNHRAAQHILDHTLMFFYCSLAFNCIARGQEKQAWLR